MLGDYPYYRADPGHWAANLRAMADAGIDTVTCYVPWRWHEIAPGEHDFTGRTDPRRDVVGFLRLVADAGLDAVVKPGPFVHAEVPFGGLPDRVSPSRDASRAAVLDADGMPATAYGLRLPSWYDERFRTDVGTWLSAVDDEILAATVSPTGPVIGVQVGNEGVYSDAHQPVWRHDFAAAAIRAFADWLRPRSGFAEVAQATAPRTWSPQLRVWWTRWSGHALRDTYRELADAMPTAANVERLVNLPLPSGASADTAGWLLRTSRLAGTDLTAGYTGWVGNAARSSAAFAAHWFGVRARRSANVETNWGFTWSDPAHAEPSTPLFHSLLGLGLGSSSCAVYTACATEGWGPEMVLDPAGLRAEGLRPADYEPPYCPGAPLRETGGTNPNIEALHQLRDLVRQHGAILTRGRLVADVLLLVGEPLAEAAAWPGTEDEPPLASAIELSTALLTDHQYGVDVITEATAPSPGDDPHRTWLVPVTDRPDARLRGLVQARRSAGGALLLVATAPTPELAAAWGGPVLDVRYTGAVLGALPPPAHGHPDSDQGPVLVHADADGRPLAVFAFNPADRPVIIRRRVDGLEITVALAPGGSACVLCHGSTVELVCGAGLLNRDHDNLLERHR